MNQNILSQHEQCASDLAFTQKKYRALETKYDALKAEHEDQLEKINQNYLKILNERSDEILKAGAEKDEA